MKKLNDQTFAYLLILIICCSSSLIYGQSKLGANKISANISENQTNQRCHTDAFMEERLEDPDFAQQFYARQSEIESSIDFNQKQPACTTPLIFPVAVHYGGSVTGANPQCLLDAAQAQIDQLNLDFSNCNSNAGLLCSWIEDCPSFGGTQGELAVAFDGACFQFCLADQNLPADANLVGGAAAGYAITVSNCSINPAQNNANNCWTGSNGDANLWNGYLNLFVGDYLTYSINGVQVSLLGIAPLSGSSNPAGDGPYTVAANFGAQGFSACSSGTGIGNGAPFNGGATETHELGHYFGLQHTFSDSFVDTPGSANGCPNYGCPSVNVNTCSASGCSSNMNCTQNFCDGYSGNFMDYVDDDCMHNFTEDQVNWMQATVAPQNQWATNAISCVTNYPACTNQPTGCTPTQGCTDAAYCNYDPNAIVDDGSCSGLIGSPCDDGDLCTDSDEILADCSCQGTPSISSCDPACGLLNTIPCDDGDPCTINDEVTLTSDNSVCVPCAGTAGAIDVFSYSIDQTVCAGSGINVYVNTLPNAVVNLTISNNAGQSFTYNTTPADANGDVAFGITSIEALYTLTINSVEYLGCVVDLSSLAPVTGVAVDCTNSCLNPIAINCGDVVYGSNELAPIESIDACLYGGGYPNDVYVYWYTLTGTGDFIDIATINTGNNSFYAVPFVLTGACGTLLCEQETLNNFNLYSSGSSTSFQSVAGTTYYIGVGDILNYDLGTFELTISCTDVCLDNLTRNGNPEYPGLHKADNWIESTSKVNAATGAPVIYQAGDEYIELQIGFEADGTVDFDAEIEDCDPGN